MWLTRRPLRGARDRRERQGERGDVPVAPGLLDRLAGDRLGELQDGSHALRRPCLGRRCGAGLERLEELARHPGIGVDVPGDLDERLEVLETWCRETTRRITAPMPSSEATVTLSRGTNPASPREPTARSTRIA